MAIKRTGTLFFILWVLIASGCSTGISQQSLSKVTYMGTFLELQAAPDKFVGEIVILGGKIIEVHVTSTSSELTVSQMPLDHANRPLTPDQSKGRFLIRSDQFLDPAIYKKEDYLSAVGIIKGSRTRPIGDFDYVYPLMEAIEIKLWPKDDLSPSRIHFGIGFGTSF